MMRLFVATLSVIKLIFLMLLGSNQAFAQNIDLEQAMAHPDWIGRAPQQPYWSDNSDAIYFRQKREEAEQFDLYRVALDGTNLEQIDPAQLGVIDMPAGSQSSDNRFKTYAREGDIYVKNLRSSNIAQLTRSSSRESNPFFNADNNKVIFTRNNTIFVRDLDSGLEYQAADLRMEDAPAADEQVDFLAAQQLRLFEIIRLQDTREKLAEQNDLEIQQQDPSRIDPPYYLGESIEIVSSALSPNENWLIVTVRNSTEREPGRVGNMPNYVTPSGYVENREVRTRVGTTDFANQQLFLLDLKAHQFAELDLSALPGRYEDPLADQLGIKSADSDSEIDKAEKTKLREIQFSGLRWSEDGDRLLFQAISRDNKDCWLLALDTAGLDFSVGDNALDENNVSLMAALKLGIDKLHLIHHNSDVAWINRGFTTAGWLPDNESLYFLSEEDGYGHLYLYQNGETQQLTKGDFEVREPTVNKDGSEIYFRGNVSHPTVFEIYRVDVRSKQLQQISSMGGMNNFRLAPDDSRLLITHSDALNPTELYVQNVRPNARATQLTNTISAEFQAIEWAQPEFVEVPSTHVDDPIHSRVYTPKQGSQSKRGAVVFIHGAGYLENAHQGWSSYFREFMFHSFLVGQGYVVLDMDF